MRPELKFFYGPMSSMKTATLLMTNYTLRKKDICVWLIKSAIDNRSGEYTIASRVGLSATADAIVSKTDCIKQLLSNADFANYALPDIILVDECQFLTGRQIEELRDIVSSLEIPVYCYGLKTDASTHLFEGSKRLLELADSFAELETHCECGEKAIINARINENKSVINPDKQIDIGGNEKYLPMCYSCWVKAGGCL